MQPLTIGLTNGILFFITWLVIGIASTTDFHATFIIMLFILVPASFIVTWRGYKLASFFQSSSVSLKTFAIDGFKWGFLIAAVVMFWSISTELWAAGGHIDSTNLFSTQTVKYLVFFVLPICFLSGLIGALHGVVFFYLNRWLYTANKQRQRTRSAPLL